MVEIIDLVNTKLNIRFDKSVVKAKRVDDVGRLLQYRYQPLIGECEFVASKHFKNCIILEEEGNSETPFKMLARKFFSEEYSTPNNRGSSSFPGLI